MPDTEAISEDKLKAVMSEIQEALENLVLLGQCRTIFTNRMGLNEQEQQALRDLLGQGAVTIDLDHTAEPVSWQESGISGVWYGTYFDKMKSPLLETIEVAFFPEVATAQEEDIQAAIKRLAMMQESKGTAS